MVRMIHGAKRHYLFASLAFTLPSALAAQAADTGEDKAPDPIFLVNEEAAEDGIFRFDYGVPSSPALALLGQPEDKVTVVNGLKPFILQLPKILENDEDGQSLALDVAPAWLLGDPSRRTYSNYIEHRAGFRRILYRTHLGAALFEGTPDTDPTKAIASRIAVGLSTSLLDFNDPLMASLPGESVSAWQQCLDRGASTLVQQLAIVTANDDGARARNAREHRRLVTRRQQVKALIRSLEGNPGHNPDDLRAAQAEEQEITGRIDELNEENSDRRDQERKKRNEDWAKSEAAKVIPGCIREANTVAQYGQSLNVGLGGLWNGTPGKLKGFSSAGLVGWLSYRRPLNIGFERNNDGELKPKSYWMIGLSARMSIDEVVATGDTTNPQVEANVFDGWAGLERLTPSSRLALQGGYQIRDTDGRLPTFDRKRFRYFASFSQRLGGPKAGTWLQVGYGHARSGDEDDEALTVSLIFAPPAPANLFGTQ